MILLKQAMFASLLAWNLLAAWFWLRKRLDPAESWVAALVLVLAQIVAVVLILGFGRGLWPWSIGLGLILFALLHTGLSLLEMKSSVLSLSWKPRNTGYLNRFVMAAVMAWVAFLLVEAWVLPPRGWDSLTYHLSNPLMWLQNGRIILPNHNLLQINAGFAYPFNGEALYLVQLALTKTQRFLGLGPVIYMLGCLPGLMTISKKEGVLAFGLFALAPVGLAQAITNYVDWAFSFWFIAGLAFTVSFWRRPSGLRLFLALLSVSVLAGVKYTGFGFWIIFSVVLGIISLRKGYFKWFCLFGMISLGLFAPWYIRNWVQLGNPFYIIAVKIGPWTIFPGKTHEFTYGYQYLSTWHQVLVFPLRDIGIGTYEGGAGPLFWFLGFPAGLWFLAVDIIKRNWQGALVWAFLLVFLWVFISIPAYIHPGELRLVMPWLAIGFLAAARVYQRADRPWVLSGIITACLLLQLAGTFRLMEHRVLPGALRDYMAGKRVSLMSYYSYQFPQAAEWARLDAQDTTVQVPDTAQMISPLFGSDLQNRVIRVSTEEQ